MSKVEELPFPSSFTFGAATSSYQIEGATSLDGRGESIWDRFSATPGKIIDASDGSVACDHYHRFPEDVGIMAELGLQAYRFSIAWPRIIPLGTGRIEPRGLDFYSRLVDTLLERDITPFVTLYHWDLPQPLEDAGGWPNRDTAHAFLDYVDVVTRHLGDRVRHWITHNEPWCVSMLGYSSGEHAPGRKEPAAAFAAAHHVLLSHGWAVPIIRRNVPNALVGAAPNLVPGVAASGSQADAEALRKFEGWFNRWYLDPLFGKGYPQDVIDDEVKKGNLPSHDLEFVQEGDLEAIGVETDFLGINYYSRGIIRSDELPEAENAPRQIFEPEESLKTDMGWEVYPDGLCDILTWVHKRYAPKSIYITENGCAYDYPHLDDGTIHDTRRIEYYRGHLQSARRAIEAGVHLDGFFLWSLMDNFEWAEGYVKRFGMVHVNYGTLERTVKDSGHYYRRVIAERRVVEP